MSHRLALLDLTLRHPEHWGGEPGRAYPVIPQTNSGIDTGLTLAQRDLTEYLRSVDGTPGTEAPCTATPKMMEPEEFPPDFIPCVNVDEQGEWLRTWLEQSGLHWAEPMPKERQELLRDFDIRRHALLRQSGQEPVNYWQQRQQIISGALTHIEGLGHLSLYREV